MCHKQTDDGRVVYITCIPRLAVAKFLKVHNVEIAHVTLTTPLSGNIFHRQGGTCYGKSMYQI